MLAIDLITLVLLSTLIILLLIKPGRNRSDGYLAFALLLFLLLWAAEYIDGNFIDLVDSGYYFLYPLTVVCMLYTGPAFYFHARSLVPGDPAPYAKLHWIFPMVDGLLLFALMALAPEENSGLMSVLYYFHTFLVLVSILFYGILLITFYQRMSLKSGGLKLSLKKWIRVLTVIYMVYALCNFSYLFLWDADAFDRYEILWTLDSLLAFFYILGMFYFSHKYGILFPGAVKQAAEDEESVKRWQMLFAKLDGEVREHSLFLNPGLTIEDLSRRLSTNDRYISKAVNVAYGDSVTNYLNNFRLEMFKEKLRDKRNLNLSMDALWAECGFNSKSSFNRFFKKSMGMTPSEYRNSIEHS